MRFMNGKSNMHIRQLRYLCHIARHGGSITDVAKALHTSQPSVSRDLRALELDLGVELFHRSRNRIVGLTDRGYEALRLAQQAVDCLDNLRTLGAEWSGDQRGTITIAASQTLARFLLPRIIVSFKKQHPQVHVTLRQSDPGRVAELVASGGADFSISPEPPDSQPGIVYIPCLTHKRVVLVPESHPLQRVKRFGFEHLARYPLITFEQRFSIYSQVTEGFAAKGLVPNIVLTATDAEVIKTYVRHGLGVAIVASVANEMSDNTGLVALDASHLFKPRPVKIGLRRQTLLRSYVYDFLLLLSPALQRSKMEKLLFAD